MRSNEELRIRQSKLAEIVIYSCLNPQITQTGLIWRNSTFQKFTGKLPPSFNRVTVNKRTVQKGRAAIEYKETLSSTENIFIASASRIRSEYWHHFACTVSLRRLEPLVTHSKGNYYVLEFNFKNEVQPIKQMQFCIKALAFNN